MEKVFCYYHNDDLDGVTSASVVQKKHPNARFFGWNYGESLETVDGYDIVFVVDLTLPEDVMKNLIKYNKRLIWIDHHGRKIKDMEKSIDIFVDGLRDTKNEHSACVLTWKYIFPNEETPSLLRYVEDIDLWKFKFPTTDSITTSLWILYGKNPEAYIDLLNEVNWNKDLLNNISKGNLFIKQRKEVVKDILKKVKIGVFKGFRTAFVNSSTFQSFVGNESILQFDVDIALIWNVEKEGFVRCGLRGNKHVDVSKIAKEFGGGGHPQASGFQINLKEFIKLIE